MKRIHTLFFSLACLFVLAPSAYSTCTITSTPGPSVMHDLVYDSQFSQDCEEWVFSGGAEKMYPGAELYDFGTVVQDLEVDSDGNFEGMINVDVLQQGNVNDRLRVELLDANGNLLETLATFSRSYPGGRTNFFPANYYDGQTVKLRLRYTRGPFGGGTTFRVNSVHLWVFN